MLRLILVMSVCVFMGCLESESTVDYSEHGNQLIDGLTIVEYDGCDYIRNRTYYGYYVYTQR